MDPSQVNVVLCYKNFAAQQNISHIGLGVSMLNIAKVLVQNGLNARVQAIRDGTDLVRIMQNDPSITHCVIAAPWLPTGTLSWLCDQYPRTNFVVNCHSNVGFLQADYNGIQLLRENMQLEAGKFNFHLAGNSRAFCDSVVLGYGYPCTYLPNMYYIDDTSAQIRPTWAQTGGVLRLGIFGATRWQKNFLTAIMAALIAARALKAQTAVYINSARVDGSEVWRILAAAQKMTQNMPAIALNYVPWAAWPAFRDVVDSMHCLISPSYTESFNLVTADGAAKQVPSAVSHAIDWTPDSWQCEMDDAPALSKVIQALVSDPQAGKNGLQALMEHNAEGWSHWANYLVNQRFGVSAAKWTGLGIPLDYRHKAAYSKRMERLAA